MFKLILTDRSSDQWSNINLPVYRISGVGKQTCMSCDLFCSVVVVVVVSPVNTTSISLEVFRNKRLRSACRYFPPLGNH